MDQAIFQQERKLEIEEVAQWLLHDDIICPQEMHDLMEFASQWEFRDKPLVDIFLSYHDQHPLLNQRKFDEDQFNQWLCTQIDLPYFYIDPLKIDVVSVTAVCSKPYALRFGILPVKVDEQTITVATSQPFMHEWERDLHHLFKKTIQCVYANPNDILRYTEELYAFSKSVKGASDRIVPTSNQINNLEQLVELGEQNDLEANNQHIVNLVNWLFQYAFDQRASDIHLEPRRDTSCVRFRIDGVMHQVYELPGTVMDAVLSRIKTLGRMNIAEKRRPQDGRLKTLNGENEVELRLSTMPTAFGEKLVMRIFDPEILLRNFSQLGFSKNEQTHWQEITAHKHGIILVTGPTGSGKTTTLYSTLKQLSTSEVNLCTVEDPIELIETSFNQMQVQHNIGLDFAAGIRTLLRQDPDIIMVGEIRDLETAEMAIQASLTGHLVLSTLHTNNAASAVTRLMEIGVKPYLIKSTLLGVMAQRLIRTLCPQCKTSGEVSDEEWNALSHPYKIRKPVKIYEAVGCNDCRQTGYSGRVGIYEVFKNSAAIQQLLIEDCEITALQKQAIKEGMRSLRISGIEKIVNGITSIEEVLRVVPVSTVQ